MGINFFMIIFAIMVYIMFNYNPVYTCQKDCAKLTYSQMCNKTCENEFDSRRYDDTFGKRKKIDNFVPSKAWYGFSSRESDLSSLCSAESRTSWQNWAWKMLQALY